MSTTTQNRQATHLPSPNAAVIRAIRAHHNELAEQLAARTRAVLDAADTGREAAEVLVLRDRLCDWYRSVLHPHVRAEETTLYAEGEVLAEARLLVRAMLEEHRVLEGVVSDLERASRPVRVAALATTLQRVFDVHLGKENDLLVPALDQASVPLATVLDGMHEVLGQERVHVG